MKTVIKEVKIITEYIKLDQFLKYQGIASTGGEAKFIISEGKVKVNGDIEYSRGRKLVPRDIIEYEKERFKIV